MLLKYIEFVNEFYSNSGAFGIDASPYGVTPIIIPEKTFVQMYKKPINIKQIKKDLITIDSKINSLNKNIKKQKNKKKYTENILALKSQRKFLQKKLNDIIKKKKDLN